MSFLDFKTRNMPADLTSGAVSALIAIPDAIASALLAGVNPTYAFDALMTGTPIGSLLSSSHFMSIGLTSAMMLAVADALVGFDESEFLTALFTLTVLVGVFQLILGLLKLGKFTSFISNTVMVGFLTGVAVLVILGQLGDLTGYESEVSSTIGSAVDTLLHPGEWDLPSLVIGLVTVALILLLSRTRLKNFSVALAMVIGTAAVLVLSLDSVAQVGDTTPVSGSFPTPVLPDLSLVTELALSAVAIGLIGLIQASGVSQSIPNPDGEYPDASRDFSAQGIANVVAGAFQGLPLGGSLGGTGLVISTGARSRWANVFLGLFVAVFVLLFALLVDLVAMPTIAAILIVVGIQIIDREEVADVWQIQSSKRAIMVVTFIATLTLPIQQAVIIGVFLSFIDYVYSSSRDVQLFVLRHTEAGTFVEEPAPAELSDDSVTIVFARGSTYFAAARTIQELLPSAKEARRAVVIGRIRGTTQVGSTMVTVLERYARELRANGGRLMLSGVHENVKEQLLRTETTDDIPEDAIFMATENVGESTRAAVSAAKAWIAQQASDATVDSEKADRDQSGDSAREV
ncbi:MAG: SulP family inorganic anion transporter [Chloroflexota bacterium]|nr:MAG: SulP family inorganic anion transporter [Chloroflexota bacterium]